MNLLDLPHDLLARVLAHGTFRQQDIAACANVRLRAAVDTARRDAAHARMADPDRLIRCEALPLVTELGVERDVTFSGAVPKMPPCARVLAAFDRLVPPPPCLAEGALHRWYREAAALEAGGDGIVYTTGFSSRLCYVGGTDSWQESPEGFGTTRGGDGSQAGYTGGWREGIPSGLGLLTLGAPDGPHAWYHGFMQDAEPPSPCQWARRADHGEDRMAFENAVEWVSGGLNILPPGQELSVEILREIEAKHAEGKTLWVNERLAAAALRAVR